LVEVEYVVFGVDVEVGFEDVGECGHVVYVEVVVVDEVVVGFDVNFSLTAGRQTKTWWCSFATHQRGRYEFQ